MVSRSDVEVLRTASSDVAKLAVRDLEKFWSYVDLSKPERARNALMNYVPLLTDRYGEMAATIAADWYEDVREAEGVAGRFAAEMAPTVPREAVQKRVRYGAGHLFTETPEATLGFLKTEVVAKYVMRPGRDTLIRSAHRDGATWARVPRGKETCAFCLMLASRGFVYESESSAGISRRNQFHGDCDCAVVPSWSDDPRLEGYDPDALYGKYLDARSVADGSGTDAILSSLRHEQGIS